MEFIKGVTFAPFSPRGSFAEEEAFHSLDLLISRTNANFIILVPNALQETAQSKEIHYTCDATTGDDELIKIIDYIHEKGLRTAIKPTVNCKNGTWRAYINFFDFDIHCEPKWSDWFASYTEFQLHFAGIAEKTNCEMFIAGCEMVMSERRCEEWRKLIARIKSVYAGPVTYNTDKYQEDRLAWWDCVDVISSSGYYPLTDWEQELDRIEPVVKKYNKPFFFAECGCMSVTGASQVPNDWYLRGEYNPEEQKDWYIAMFEACRKRPWVNGFGIWDWPLRKNPCCHNNYNISDKPAEKVIAHYYSLFS